MSRRGLTNYFGLALSDKAWTIPGAYAKVYEMQNITFNLDVSTSRPAKIIYVDGIPVTIPLVDTPTTVRKDYNKAVAQLVTIAFAANTKWTVLNDEVMSEFVRKDVYGTFDLIEVLDTTGEILADVRTTKDGPGCKTAAEAFYNALKLDNQTAVIDTNGSFINGIAYAFGLEKGAKLETPEEGDEDNNGKKDVKVSVTASIVGVDDPTDGNVILAALDGIAGERKYVFLVDIINGLVIRGNNLVCNMTENYEGNAKSKIAFTASDIGAKSDLLLRKIMV